MATKLIPFSMTTVGELWRRFFRIPEKMMYFIDPESERRIKARLVIWTGPGWYSYDGSLYRAGRRAAYSQIYLVKL